MSITIPRNVRQMGEPEAARKIYVEDYVVTYLRQYAKEEMQNSRSAILLGSAEEQEGVPYLFIRSAIGLEMDMESEDSTLFTDQLWMKIYEEIEKYFKGQEILGWFLSVPGFPLEVSYEISDIHRHYFAGWDKVLFMEDPMEGEEAFFAMKGDTLERQNGYFIFYERNEPMQKYMLEKRDGKSVDAQEEFTDRAARSFRMHIQEKRDRSSQRRVMTFLYGVSTFLVMVVLVIGITMINNYEKMEQVEMALNSLTQSLEGQQESGRSDKLDAALEQEAAAASEEGEQALQAAQAGVSKESPDAAEDTEIQDPQQSDLDFEAAAEEPPAEEPQPEEPPAEEIQPEEDAAAQEASAPAYQIYIVKKGDTLREICRKVYGNDKYVKEICELNNIEDSDMILIGEKILLP